MEGRNIENQLGKYHSISHYGGLQAGGCQRGNEMLLDQCSQEHRHGNDVSLLVTTLGKSENNM